MATFSKPTEKDSNRLDLEQKYSFKLYIFIFKDQFESLAGHLCLLSANLIKSSWV